MPGYNEALLPDDSTDRPEERLPNMLLEIVDDHTDPSNPAATMYLRHADPNPFEDGPIEDYLGTGKTQGFSYGQLGDKLTDRTAQEGGDGYRFHDLLHGVMAQKYSPVFRGILNVPRRSRPAVDDSEDGPRTKIQEEGILNRFGLVLATQPSQSEIIRAANRLSIAAAAEVQPFLQPGTEIPPEYWREALLVGAYLMNMVQASIGQITEKDRNPAVPNKEKLHSAWIYINRDNSSIHLSLAGGEHALSGEALEVYAAVRRQDELLAARATSPDRPVVMGTIDGQTYYFRHSDLR